MAELHFFTGTMDSGKSTLALQTNHNHAARGRVGRIFTTHDRAGQAVLSSRLGLTHDALEVDSDFDFWSYVVTTLTRGGRIDLTWATGTPEYVVIGRPFVSGSIASRLRLPESLFTTIVKSIP